MVTRQARRRGTLLDVATVGRNVKQLAARGDHE
jgi:hypothetical protein